MLGSQNNSFYGYFNVNLQFTKQATLMRRSTVPSLPPQLVFPGLSILNHPMMDILGLEFNKTYYNLRTE